MTPKLWEGAENLPASTPIGPLGWVRVALRGLSIALVTYLGLALLLLLRLIERPLFGLKRPITPWITQAVCRIDIWLLGLRLTVKGRQSTEGGALVANHTGWIDILTLNAVQRMYFVSKDDVAGWPGIGWLARATGTVFIQRKGTEALAQKNLFEARLRAGHKLLFFPEGTSTDGIHILPFKSTLFAAFFSPALKDVLSVQPVSVVYTAPRGQDPRFYGWWGEMGFGEHLLKVLAAPRQGSVEIIFHDPVKVADFPDRKALCAYAEGKVIEGFGGKALVPEGTKGQA